jgi:hypothetical protein
MVRLLKGEDYEEFVREKRAAAVHFDADWDVGYRPITRQRMREAEQVLAGEVNFGEIDVDRDIPLAKSIGLLGVPAVAYYFGWATRGLVTGHPTGHIGTIGTSVTRRTNWPKRRHERRAA